MNNYIKYTLYAVLTIIAIPVLLAVALYIPPIQNFAVRLVANYASEETGMNISVEHVNLVFPLDLGVDGVLVTQKNDSLPQVTDTIAQIDHLVADVQLMPLFDYEVEIDRFDMYGMKVNTADFVHQARVKGRLGTLSLQSHGIHLNDETVNLDNVYLADARLDVALSDTVPPDTTDSKTPWKIRLEKLSLKNADVTLRMPGDTMIINTGITKATANNGYFDLYKGLYTIANADILGGRIKYDNTFMPRQNLLPVGNGGLDINHLAFSNVNIGIDSLYFCDNDLKVNVKHGKLVEKCGIGINNLTAKVKMDSTLLDLNLDLATRNVGQNPSSKVRGNVLLDLNVLDSINPGKLVANIDASLAKTDLLLAMGSLPSEFQKAWPSSPLSIKTNVAGNLNRIDIDSLFITLPSAFRLRGSGYAVTPMDTERMKAQLHLDANTEDLSFVKSMLDKKTANMIGIPALHAVADINAEGQKYGLAFTVSESNGKINGKGSFDACKLAYAMNLDATNFNVGGFVRGYALGHFTGSANVNGQGFDFTSSKTTLLANAKVKKFKYDKWDLAGMEFNADLRNGHGHLLLDSHNPLLDGTMALDALMSRSPIQATFTTELNTADLYHLYLAEYPVSVSACAHIDVATDLDDYFMVQGLVSDLTIRDTAKVYRPDDMVVDILTRKDTTHAVVDCGDFHLNADAKGGYKILMKVTDRLSSELQRQLSARIIDEEALRRVLPIGHFYLSAGRDNPVARSLKYLDIDYANAYLDITSSPFNGLNGVVRLDTLVTNDTQIDYIYADLKSDAKDVNYDIVVENGPQNPQYSFRANAKGSIVQNGTSLAVSIDDDRRKRVADLSLAAIMEENGIRLSFDKKKQVLGYMDFSVNSDNRVFFGNDMRLSADVRLKGPDGTSIQVYTDDDNVEALQDVTLSLANFDIQKILSTMPYMPKATGILNGDFHAIITPDNISVASDVGFRNLVYENCPIGNLSSEFVYMPTEDGSHQIDGMIYKDGKEVGTVIGTYSPIEDGYIDATVTMSQFPLDIANGFIPDRIVGLEGFGSGEISVKGHTMSPIVNGKINMEKASLVSVPYGVSLNFADTPIEITESNLSLKDFKMWGTNSQPLVCNGYVDFADFDHMFIDLRMKARNFQLVDAKETRRSEAYGKAFVNVDAKMIGELSHLAVTGDLQVLSTTDLYYILRDSPITTDNRLKELVTFTDLNAGTEVKVTRPTVDGMTVRMNIGVTDGSHMKCWLNTNHTNYVDIFAGGNLFATYRAGNVNVSGRCTISEGQMKYSLPVIPLKTFTIENGSYIEFTGDMMNPKLNISATEDVKTTVQVDGANQSVLFNCGVAISKTLNDMGLQFTIDAPENQTIAEELASKTQEERGKLAVTMLTTGMYLSETNTDAFTMNSALTSFLQSEINQIAGSALRTLDLSVGLENSIDASGENHTDYAFKFAKRFWNNRLSISVGGKISTGPEVANQNNSFFDNVEFQYRLSDTSNQYLQLFYKRAVYDNLEGYVGQYGAGYMWKRKLQSLSDIFPKKTVLTPDNE